MTLTIELRAGELVTTLAPAVGGAIANFYSQRGTQQQHWLRPSEVPDPAMPWTMPASRWYPLPTVSARATAALVRVR